nr:MAG TPA: hypothetical protein [Caudoviricetes sp.]DAX26089.1 MAG TPA: hypothetical protein [Caudoviricetes sp.]DAY03732.1 MAG TPA: hypothetical protein [Bacteriophage sp.]
MYSNFLLRIMKNFEILLCSLGITLQLQKVRL